MDRKKQRIISFAVCILFIFVTFASLVYLVKEENHSCTGEDCPVCACMHQAEQTLKRLGTGTIVTITANLVRMITVCLITGLILIVSCVSLVSQKVRLND